jgi:hypothetical protein
MTKFIALELINARLAGCTTRAMPRQGATERVLPPGINRE